MFETRPPRSDALDSDAGWAPRTARSLNFAWRQLIGKLSVRHNPNLRLLCPGVDLKSRRNDLMFGGPSHSMGLKDTTRESVPRGGASGPLNAVIDLFHTGRHRFFPRSKMRWSLDGSASG
jgi:hypothetical protein